MEPKISILKAKNIFIIILFFSVNAIAQKPKLVVGIVVDQMRVDYLSRYESKFGEGGFKKDRNAAIDLYRRAAAKGHKASGDRLKKLEVAS